MVSCLVPRIEVSDSLSFVLTLRASSTAPQHFMALAQSLVAGDEDMANNEVQGFLYVCPLDGILYDGLLPVWQREPMCIVSVLLVISMPSKRLFR